MITCNVAPPEGGDLWGDTPTDAGGWAFCMAGLYVHIPFCRQACHYCDFHFTVNLAGIEALIEGILAEARWQAPAWAGVRFDTLYLGGGTPGLLPVPIMSHLIAGLMDALDLSGIGEVTLEANPDDVTAETLEAWLQMGFTRLSLGIQTLDDERLAQLNRSHDAGQARRAVALAQAAGLPALSVDLMFGLPGQDEAALARDLEAFIGLGADHLSAYCLTIEPGTVFGRRASRGTLWPPPPPEPLAAHMLYQVRDRLAVAGYEGYEVSNFARGAAARSRHNSAYWAGGSYLGLGPSAHSFDGAWRRWASPRSNGRYLAGLSAGQPVYEEETLTPADRLNEQIMTGLRVIEGVDAGAWAARLGVSLPTDWHAERGDLIREGLLDPSAPDGWLRLTRTGLALADHVAGRLFV